MGTLYAVTCGGYERTFHAISDTKARAVASRLLRLIWPRYVASCRPGSLGAAWARDADEIVLYRWGVDSAGIYSSCAARIDTWSLGANGYIAQRYSALGRGGK